MDKFAQGDKVSHFRDPKRVGTVIEVEPDEYSSVEIVYHVAWSEDGPAIPYRSGLVKAGMCTIHNGYGRSCLQQYGHEGGHTFED